MSETVKKHNNKNNYYLTTTGLWVRDFRKNVIPEDINTLVAEKDYALMLDNEMRNAAMNLAGIDVESTHCPRAVIVSDGHRFEECLPLLKGLKVTVIGVNRTLVKWDRSVRMDWYVANNPYPDCLSFLPDNYFPRCVVSSRTNPDFVKKYRDRKGVVYRYLPVTDRKFSPGYFQQPLYKIDDYRNPVCAAIGLAYRWGVRKLLLFCCDGSFSDKRPGSHQLPNGLWEYPQQKVSHGLIDGMLRWMEDVKKGDFSSGDRYKNAKHITEEGIQDFFET